MHGPINFKRTVTFLHWDRTPIKIPRFYYQNLTNIFGSLTLKIKAEFLQNIFNFYHFNLMYSTA